MSSTEIKKTILTVIDLYGELTVKKLVEELQIRGLKEDDTRNAFREMIDEGILQVDWDKQLIIGNPEKGSKYLEGTNSTN